jgi:hypothetical protein
MQYATSNRKNLKIELKPVFKEAESSKLERKSECDRKWLENLTPEQREARAENGRKWLENLTPEQREARVEYVRKKAEQQGQKRKRQDRPENSNKKIKK